MISYFKLLKAPLFAVILLTFLVKSTLASEDWVKVATSEDDLIIFYISEKSVQKSGEIIRVEEVINTTQKDAPISMKVTQEYDCGGEKLRTLSGSLHSGHFGSGSVLSKLTNTSNGWRSIPSGSSASYIREFLCKR